MSKNVEKCLEMTNFALRERNFKKFMKNAASFPKIDKKNLI